MVAIDHGYIFQLWTMSSIPKEKEYLLQQRRNLQENRIPHCCLKCIEGGKNFRFCKIFDGFDTSIDGCKNKQSPNDSNFSRSDVLQSDNIKSYDP